MQFNSASTAHLTEKGQQPFEWMFHHCPVMSVSNVQRHLAVWPAKHVHLAGKAATETWGVQHLCHWAGSKQGEGSCDDFQSTCGTTVGECLICLGVVDPHLGLLYYINILRLLIIKNQMKK